MTIEGVIWAVIVPAMAFYLGRSIGFKSGHSTIFSNLVDGITRHMNAANYWRDRALLAEQKIEMLVLASTRFVGPQSVQKWRAACTAIVQSGGTKT